MNKNLYLLLVLMMLSCFSLNSQRLLQIEVFNEVKAIKIYEGQQIQLKSPLYGKEWEVRTIESFNVEENLIVFEDGYLQLSDINEIRLINQTARLGGKMFQGFGLGWFLFGTIAHFANGDRYRWSWTDAGIGATAIGVGLLMDKVVAKKTYKAGKNANFRLLDISFPEPQKVVKP